MPGMTLSELTDGELEVMDSVEIEGMRFVKIGDPSENSFVTDSYYLVNGNDMTLTNGFDEIWVIDGTVVGRQQHKDYIIESDGTIAGEYHPGTDYFNCDESYN